MEAESGEQVEDELDSVTLFSPSLWRNKNWRALLRYMVINCAIYSRAARSAKAQQLFG